MFDAHSHEVGPAAYALARSVGVDGWLWASLEPTDPAPPDVWRAYGLHPWNALALTREECEQSLAALELRLEHDRPQALGEIGLDHFRARGAEQRRHGLWVFQRQLELARRFELPVVVHCVRCHPEVIAQLRHAALPRGGIIHSFEGPSQWIGPYREMGYLLSLSPHSLRHLSELPSEGILIETDAPGRGAQLRDLPEVAGEVARRLGLSPHSLIERCDRSLQACLG